METGGKLQQEGHVATQLLLLPSSNYQFLKFKSSEWEGQGGEVNLKQQSS